MITRRKLLAGIAAASAAAAVPTLSTDWRTLARLATPPDDPVLDKGFGLAQAKPEGGRMLYDAPELRYHSPQWRQYKFT